MSPEAFVLLLAEELQVAGVVVGSNYRFGYKAAGTAELLRALGPQHGMQVRVLDLVQGLQGSSGSPEGCVSSSAVREALSAGDMALVADCLGRPYRLVASLADVAGGSGAAAGDAPAVLRWVEWAVLARLGHAGSCLLQRHPSLLFAAAGCLPAATSTRPPAPGGTGCGRALLARICRRRGRENEGGSWSWFWMRQVCIWTGSRPAQQHATLCC